MYKQASIVTIISTSYVFMLCSCLTYEQEQWSHIEPFIEILYKDSHAKKQMYADLADLVQSHDIRDDYIQKIIINAPNASVPLFKYYPKLQQTLSYVSCAQVPTPVEPLCHAAKVLGIQNLYCKRDDLTGKKQENSFLVGGNKVRKLEFLLADALAHNAPVVITCGCAGSNHTLATGVYAQQLGLKSIALLRPQHKSALVKRNLLRSVAADIELYPVPTRQVQALALIAECVRYKQRTGKCPYVVPVGGSCPRGVLGYINAAFELKQQIADKILPEPDRIYVPVGSGGTYAGLWLGAQAARLKSQIIGVIIEPEEYTGSTREKLVQLIEKTCSFIKAYDASFSTPTITPENITLVTTACGLEYALPTEQAYEAASLLKSTQGIVLDEVYTAKTFAGLKEHIKINPVQAHETVLYWHTFCANNFNSISTINLDYIVLPYAFHSYFK